MKRFILLSILIGLLVPTLVSARNQIIYRPFNWQKVEWDNIILYYPKQMEQLIPATMSLIDSLNKVYSSEIYANYKDYLDYYQRYIKEMREKQKYKSTFREFNEDYKKQIQVEEPDTIPALSDSAKNNLNTINSWRPQKIVIIVYPSFQDFKQEKVIDALIPPGLLGFMEIFGYRICVPYSGNWYDYSTTLAHEIGHAWNYLYLEECENKMKKILRGSGKNIEEKRYAIPLWFIEGWAQYSSYTFQKDNYDYLRCLLEDQTRQDITSLENSMLLLNQMQSEVYYLGANFICWMSQRFGHAKLVELQQQIVYLGNFNRAWEFTFKEAVEKSEKLWHAYLVQKYYITIYADSLTPADSQRVKKAETPGPLIGYVDCDNNRWIYYTKSGKWGTEMVITDLKTKQTIKLHRQFQNQSLWYRLNNRPTIKGDFAAFVNNREGQDELIVYRLINKKKKASIRYPTDNPKITAKKIKVFRPKGILSINNPRLINETQIIFEAITLNGYSDLYIWNFKDNTIIRLTDDFYQDAWPTPFGDKILFVSDRFNQHSKGLYQLDIETKTVTEIFARENAYVDQICADDSLVAFRLVTYEHSPQVFVWSPREGKIYQVYSQFNGIRQVVAFKNNNLLVIASGGAVKSIDLAEMAKIKKSFVCQPRTIPSTTWSLSTPSYTIDSFIKKADHRLKYTMIDGDWFYLSNATGERRLSFYGGGSYQRGSFLYNSWVYYLNLSNRTHFFYQFQSYQYYFWYYNRKYCTSDGVYLNDLITKDWSTSLRLQAYYPINLETGIGASIIPGYLRRIYNKYDMSTGYWNWKVDKLQTPTISGSLYFIKNAIFWGDWGNRQGTYLLAGVYSQFGFDNQIKPIEGYAVIDFRYYLQFGGSRAYWANRFFTLKAIGFDQYLYQIEGLYRGYIPYDSISGIRSDLGTSAVLFQSELRFPLFNYIAFQPAIIPRDSRQAFAFAVDAGLFWYGGDVWLDGIDRMRWINRAGMAIKIKLNYVISLKFENYKYIYSKKDLNLSNRKWGIAVEYDF